MSDVELPTTIPVVDEYGEDRRVSMEKAVELFRAKRCAISEDSTPQERAALMVAALLYVEDAWDRHRIRQAERAFDATPTGPVH